MKNRIILLVALFLLSTGDLLARANYDRIIVIVNDRVITQNEVEIGLTLRLQNANAITNNQKEELKQSLINGMIDDALLDIRADELRIEVTDDMVDDAIDRLIKANKLTKSQFEEVITRQGMTMIDFRKTRWNQMRREMVVNQEIRSAIQVDEKQLKKGYETSGNKKFLTRARHILVRVGDSDSQTDLDLALKKTKNIKELIQNGMDFETAAVQYSEDPSVKNNQGDLGFFKREDMVAEFSKAAFELEPGQLSEPIRSPFGFHLIEVIERKEQPSRPFDEIKEELYQKEYQEKFRVRYEAYLEDLKKKARIVTQ